MRIYWWICTIGAFLLTLMAVITMPQHGDSNRVSLWVFFGLDFLIWSGLGYYKYSWPLALYSLTALLISMFYSAFSGPLLLTVILAATGVWLLQPKRRMAPESCPQEGAK